MVHEEEQKPKENDLRTVFALGFVSFFTDVSTEMVFSILPTFILTLSGGSLAVLGFIEGLAEALSYSLRSISGIFADRFRRRKLMVLIGYGFSNATKPFFAVASTATDALFIRVGDRVGKAIRTSPRDVLLSEAVSDKKMGTAFGIHRTLDHLGGIVGPILASALMLLFGFGMREVFWFSFIPGIIALILILFFVKEKVSKSSNQTKFMQGVKTVLTRDFSLLLVVVGLFSLGAFDFSFVLLKASAANVEAALIPIVYAIINVSQTVVAIPAGQLSDKIGREKVLLLGYVTFLVSSALIGLQLGNALYIFPVAFIFGIYLGIVDPIQRAIVPRYAPAELKGTAYGIYYLTVGVALLVANTAVGALWQYMNISAAATYSCITSGIGIVCMILFLRRKKQAQSSVTSSTGIIETR
jgi:MFS family permease